MKLGARVIARAALAVLTLGFVTLQWSGGRQDTAYAQNLGQRTVMGFVHNGENKPIVGATVFLRNTKTKTIRSYSTTPDGRYRFAQVNMSQDFDLWAEKDGKKSGMKTVSSWDTRKESTYELAIK